MGEREREGGREGERNRKRQREGELEKERERGGEKNDVFVLWEMSDSYQKGGFVKYGYALKPCQRPPLFSQQDSGYRQ